MKDIDYRKALGMPVPATEETLQDINYTLKRIADFLEKNSKDIDIDETVETVLKKITNDVQNPCYSIERNVRIQ